MSAATRQYRGHVIDRYDILDTLHTGCYPTEDAAHEAAKKLRNRRYGKDTDTSNRMTIDVTTHYQ